MVCNHLPPASAIRRHDGQQSRNVDRSDSAADRHATLRFNFRGVGTSAGAHDAGEGEIADADAVAAWGAARWPGRGLLIAGFSFGGYIALRLALRRRAVQLITVAPAVQRFATITAVPNCPWLIVQGDAGRCGRSAGCDRLG